MSEKIVEIKPFQPKKRKNIDAVDSQKAAIASQLCCPSCHSRLEVIELSCSDCSISVKGRFPQNAFLALSTQQQTFLLEFLLSGASLKDLAKRLEKSYPTLRKELDSVLAVLQQASQPLKEQTDKRKRVVELLQEGKLSAEAAEEILNKLF